MENNMVICYAFVKISFRILFWNKFSQQKCLGIFDICRKNRFLILKWKKLLFSVRSPAFTDSISLTALVGVLPTILTYTYRLYTLKARGWLVLLYFLKTIQGNVKESQFSVTFREKPWSLRKVKYLLLLERGKKKNLYTFL